MKISTTSNKKEDITEVYDRLISEYDTIFTVKLDDTVFLYKPLGRKDFRDLLEAEGLTDASKEEIICAACTLYPENYDFENCENAGLPTKLADEILDKSLLTEPDLLKKAIRKFRNDFYTEQDSQINCIIHEAFHEYTIKEIENWGIMKTAEYLVKAEFILHNMRGVPLNIDQNSDNETIQQYNNITNANQQPQQNYTEYRQVSQQELQTRGMRDMKLNKVKQDPALNNQSNNVQASTQEPVQPSTNNKRRQPTQQELAELYRKYPGIDWANDTAMQKGVDGLLVKAVDGRAAASIPLDDSEDNENAIPDAVKERLFGGKKMKFTTYK